MSESDILRTICEYLAFRRIFFWRNNNVPVYDHHRQTFRSMPKFSRKGVPDIIAVVDGKIVGLEVKQPHKYQSPDQKKFQADLEEAGGRYCVVRSPEDVNGCLAELALSTAIVD